MPAPTTAGVVAVTLEELRLDLVADRMAECDQKRDRSECKNTQASGLFQRPAGLHEFGYALPDAPPGSDIEVAPRLGSEAVEVDHEGIGGRVPRQERFNDLGARDGRCELPDPRRKLQHRRLHLGAEAGRVGDPRLVLTLVFLQDRACVTGGIAVDQPVIPQAEQHQVLDIVDIFRPLLASSGAVFPEGHDVGLVREIAGLGGQRGSVDFLVAAAELTSAA